MTHDEIPGLLVEIHTALVEKTGHQPWIEPTIRCDQTGDWSITLYGKSHEGKKHGMAKGRSPAECIRSAFEIIDAIPDPDTAAKQQWQRKLGDVIDEGHALNLPDEVMTPLRTGSQAMTENLLAAPGVEVKA